jgi:hypothetical protein
MNDLFVKTNVYHHGQSVTHAMGNAFAVMPLFKILALIL